MRFLYLIVVNSVALFVASLLLDGFTFSSSWLSPVIAGLIITILNAIIRPIISLLSFPLVLVTGGLFLIIINGIILYITQYLVTVIDIEGVSMQIDNVLTYLIAGIIFGVSNWLLHWFFKE